MDDLNRLTHRVIGAAFAVHNTLGPGFLEKVYERALHYELTSHGIHSHPQAPLQVSYKGAIVGDYLADLLVEDRLILELKCVEHLIDIHLAQCMNYLKATGLHLALLFNFHHPKLEWKRIICS